MANENDRVIEERQVVAFERMAVAFSKIAEALGKISEAAVEPGSTYKLPSLGLTLHLSEVVRVALLGDKPNSTFQPKK